MSDGGSVGYMDLWRTENWFAVHTKASQEEVAALNIARLGIDVFIPKRLGHKLVWGVSYPVLKPLFPRYVFAKFRPDAHLHSIRYARGVRHVVSFGDLPLPVEERIIFEIQARINSEGYVRLDSAAFRKGDCVTVEEGPFCGLTGMFERELNKQDRVALLLDTIRFQARVVVEKHCLKLAREAV